MELTFEQIEEYKSADAKGVYCLSNTGGVEILDILYDIDDYVVYRYYGDDIGLAKITDDSTFFVGELEIPLIECMRV